MAMWRRRRRTPYAAVMEEERMSRYVYLLSTLPPSVVERAHEAAFGKMPLERRREMFEKLRPFMTAEERAREPQPAVLAGVFRRLTPSGGAAGTAVEDKDRIAGRASARADVERRAAELWPFNDPLLFAVVASHFITSATVVSYFTIGAGSIGIAGEPAWVGELGGIPADTGAFGGYGGDGGFGHGGDGGYGSGGYDGGGGFGGGFDGGGFGGGFDGGGGIG